MNNEEFAHVFHHQVLVSEDVLIEKAREYADDTDRLHNFKVAATLAGTTPQAALAGMMIKHTVSIYDMCRADQPFSLEKWNEKITDHINYLILLRAIVSEEAMDKAQTMLNFAPSPAKHLNF